MTPKYRHGFLANIQATAFILYALTLILSVTNSSGQEQIDSDAALNRYVNQWRDVERRKISAKLPLTQKTPNSSALLYSSSSTDRTEWKLNITTTVFWIGEKATINDPISNDKSAWDVAWFYRYGGYDDPNPGARMNFVPLRFPPRQNPFYIALPYNDIQNHHTRAEAAGVIPWFKTSFVRDGQSVCKGRWVAVRHGNRVCYAQWEDVGPFATEDWKYVFGNERPRANRNQDAGLDVSPAVRDYLGLRGLDTCDWKFVDFSGVPAGPWTKYGSNKEM
ncbi:MAG: hypothetical protein JOZ31_03910 [Verrucomicrobia bacterium]|nr:hypothetical protein [Verrucomicrobiota bacterium]